MKMSNKVVEDYKCIIEACGIQDENIQKILEQKGESAIKIQEQLRILNELVKEKDEETEHLTELKLTADKKLQQIGKTTSKISQLKKQHKNAQDEISQLKVQMQEISNGFVKNISEMGEELKMLYRQFEGDTLQNLCTIIHNELLSCQEREAQLQKTYDELKHFKNDAREYERPRVLKTIFQNNCDNETIQKMQGKLATKSKNIEVLIAQYNKQLKTLQDLSK